MHRDEKTGEPILNATDSRQANRVGLIWVLAGSLGLALVVAIGLAGYF
jgi:hypothetical protein